MNKDILKQILDFKKLFFSLPGYSGSSAIPGFTPLGQSVVAKIRITK